jgi:hypothetical protein
MLAGMQLISFLSSLNNALLSAPRGKIFLKQLGTLGQGLP